jgi:hypothetical protein
MQTLRPGWYFPKQANYMHIKNVYNIYNTLLPLGALTNTLTAATTRGKPLNAQNYGVTKSQKLQPYV